MGKLTAKSNKVDAATLWSQSTYKRRLVPDEEGGYSASVQEFPGCFAEGDTADEALRNLAGAAVAWMHAQESLGQEIPQPIDFEGYSGRVALRIPRGLHKQAAELAQEEGVSVNQFLMSSIAAVVGQKSVLRVVSRELAKLKPSFLIINATLSHNDVTRITALRRGDVISAPRELTQSVGRLSLTTG